MYHCRVRFYLIGEEISLFETMKKMPPLENFTHEFAVSGNLEAAAAEKADVIFADVRGRDAAAFARELLSAKKENAEVIMLAEKERTGELTEFAENIGDIWITPMSEGELRFRFAKWQKNFKAVMDARETSQFLETTINSIPSLIWYKDKNGIHEKVNDSFCKTVNKTKEQVQGRGHAYIWDVERDDPACIESEREVMETKQTCVAEEKILTGDGERLLTTYKSPLYDADGSVMGTAGIGIDVTKERAFEQELLGKNRTLEKIFTSIDCGILCHSIDGKRIISVNSTALKILGYETAEELKADGFDMVAHSVIEGDREMFREKMRTLKNVGDTINVEYRVEHKDGKMIHVMGNVKLLEENGETFYQRFLLDVTEQRRRESEQEKRQSELVQALSIDYNLVCFFDLGTGTGHALRLIECERNVLGNIFGNKKELLLEQDIGKYIDNCVYEDDKEMMRNVCTCRWISGELETKKMCHVNYRTLCGGNIRYFQMKAVRTGKWKNVKSAVVGFRCVDEEIRSDMEKKELLENALMQANRASKAKSVFLSNMSHDIRTPMNAIVGFTSLAISHIDNKNQVEEYLKKIMTSGNHLLSLINDVLDMSRIESGKMHLDEKPCSLPEIFHGLQSIIQGDVNAKQLELFVDTVDVHNEEIFCDKLRLNQVLLNLLSNAVKYTVTGGKITMRITEKPGAPDGFANYEFLVKDTGIGMSKEFVAHIFEPFERERNSTISGIQGTGLGMAITKNIVDMMNGTITVKSEQNVGTECTVTFMFRLNRDANEPKELPEYKNCRALVVDDDFNTCDSVSYMLQQIGMRAEWTLSGKEAVLRTRQALMRNDHYDVYIVDWLLPDVNGIEVVRRIRRETGENVPVIVLTAYDWSDIEEEAREAGVTAFCSKPLFMSELRRCLTSIESKSEKKENEMKIETKRRTERILLAEDNELNQEIAVAILGEAGFKVDVAANGKIAVDMLSKSEAGYYQLVLMDVQMPVMNGYEAATAIRALDNKQHASIPIIAMTANAFEEDRQEALKSGMNEHIAKPIDVKKLIETLDNILK
ncbi:MAG: response regulator [Ruminococcus sp.]|nr:response regulator [Ruminococcus sp.]MCM1478416.1 response regulator [Muribaculaceae bacterium]